MPSPENGEGLVAGASRCCTWARWRRMINDPEKQKLLKHKEELEQAIDELKYRKASMDVAEYRQQLAAVIWSTSPRPRRSWTNEDVAGRCCILVLPVCSLHGRRRNRPRHPDRAIASALRGPAPSRRSGRDAHAIRASDAVRRSRRSGRRILGPARLSSRPFDAFRAAVKPHPKDANLQVRWGRSCLEHWQPSDADDLFKRSAGDRQKTRAGAAGLALVAAEDFEGEAAKFAEQALEERSETVRGARAARARGARRQQSEKAAAEANKALAMSPEAWTRWRFWRPSTG